MLTYQWLDRIEQRVIPDHLPPPQKPTKVGSETVAKLKLERAADNLVGTDRKPLRHVGQSPDLLLGAGLRIGEPCLGLCKLVHPHFRAGLGLSQPGDRSVETGTFASIDSRRIRKSSLVTVSRSSSNIAPSVCARDLAAASPSVALKSS